MQTQLLIGGEWLGGTGGGEIEVENPATEEVIASVAAGTPADATAACDAAAEAQPAWAAAGAPRARRDPAGELADARSITPTNWPS